MILSDFRYPIGKFEAQYDPTPAHRAESIDAIAATPAKLRQSVAGLTEAQLETRYRDGGWTVRQVIHHVADSHMHSYARFRYALTENSPLIKPYDEVAWAELPDAKEAPVELSLGLLDALHARWSYLLRSLTAEDFTKVFRHPALGVMTLEKNVQLYAWHGRHHTAHITGLRDRMGW
jgi:uncharacterized damage-inducible protein DinB